MIPEPLVRSLNALSRRESATPFMTLLAAYQILLYRYSGQDDIAVGVPTAGRNRSELEPMIGFFVNTLVLRSDLSGNPSFRKFLAHVRDVIPVDRVEQLAALVDQAAGQRLVGLLAIPRAAVGCAKPGHGLAEFFDRRHGLWE